jgi:hypothetical protein
VNWCSELVQNEFNYVAAGKRNLEKRRRIRAVYLITAIDSAVARNDDAAVDTDT